MKKEIINTENAPGAIGPYSQAVKTGELIFTSGQIPVVPETGEIADGGVEAQTRQVLTNLEAVLAAAGSSMDKVVKTTVFITDMSDFSAVNEQYARFFPTAPPARSCVEVSKLPKAVRVEIEAVAIAHP